jgi:hypothetical protein
VLASGLVDSSNRPLNLLVLPLREVLNRLFSLDRLLGSVLLRINIFLIDSVLFYTRLVLFLVLVLVIVDAV